MTLEVLNIQGKSTGRSIELPQEIFGVEPNEHAVYLAVKQYLAAQRQGTHKAKEKWEIARTTKKLKRQKGTGTARAGSMKSPLFRGGGRVFGPKPHEYDIKVNKKVKQLAKFSAMADKANNASLMIVEDFSYEAPNTKSYISLLGNLGINGKSLLVTSELNRNVYLSGRNVGKAEVRSIDGLNTYDIINADTLVLTENSVQSLVNLFAEN